MNNFSKILIISLALLTIIVLVLWLCIMIKCDIKEKRINKFTIKNKSFKI